MNRDNLIMSVYETKTFQNGYVIKRMEYYNYKQFMNDLEEFKEKYYIIGYVANPQEGVVTVKLFDKSKGERP